MASRWPKWLHLVSIFSRYRPTANVNVYKSLQSSAATYKITYQKHVRNLLVRAKVWHEVLYASCWKFHILCVSERILISYSINTLQVTAKRGSSSHFLVHSVLIVIVVVFSFDLLSRASPFHCSPPYPPPSAPLSSRSPLTWFGPPPPPPPASLLPYGPATLPRTRASVDFVAAAARTSSPAGSADTSSRSVYIFHICLYYQHRWCIVDCWLRCDYNSQRT